MFSKRSLVFALFALIMMASLVQGAPAPEPVSAEEVAKDVGIAGKVASGILTVMNPEVGLPSLISSLIG